MANQRQNRQSRRPDRSTGARQKIEHYMALAENAQRSGDVVTAENYYQHAEHYVRTLNAQSTPAQ